VFLPGLGRATVGQSGAPITGKAGQCWIGADHVPIEYSLDSPVWTPMRRIRVVEDDLTLDVEMDDLDPYRGTSGLVVSDRLSTEDLDHWRELLQQGWMILVRGHRQYASAIASGLVSIVPLHEPDTSKGVNATSMDAFGSVSLSPPASDLATACGLLHEFQHAKLGALLNLLQLYTVDGDRRYYAPWRDDPRPLGALLQGVYAFLGVTEFWRGQRRFASGQQRAFAEFEFARWRDRVWTSFQVLVDSNRFTDAGRRFLDGLRHTQLDWMARWRLRRATNTGWPGGCAIFVPTPIGSRRSCRIGTRGARPTRGPCHPRRSPTGLRPSRAM
jgi:HEXXH motif-containing protein